MIFGLRIPSIGLVLTAMRGLWLWDPGPREARAEQAVVAQARQRTPDQKAGDHGHFHAPLPASYANQHIPARAWTDVKLIAGVQEIFGTTCAVCHGDKGDGKGPGAAALPLKPADLTDARMVAEMPGNYWFWRGSEEGEMEPFKSRARRCRRGRASSRSPTAGRSSPMRTHCPATADRTPRASTRRWGPVAAPMTGMVRNRARLGLALAAVTAAIVTGAPSASAQPSAGAAPAALTLADLERMALERNPTLPQARASVRSAEGRQQQAGIYPNPLIGYELEDLNAREPGRHKNFFWFQVPIVTAGKLQRSRDLAAADRQHAEANAEIQRLRVLTTVRMLYYEALGAARLVELRQELATLTRDAAGVSEELFNVGQADRPDVLDVEMQSRRADIELAKAQSHQRRVWRVLAASVGDPSLPLTTLAGDPAANLPALDREAIIARVLKESPEVRQAQVAMERARAALERVRGERIPNLFVRTKLGYNSESFSPGRDVGFEAGVEIGVPLPLFDRQQGNVKSAEADLEHARTEARRLELALRAQLEGVLRGYEDAKVEVEQYQKEILPRAEQSAALFRRGFGQMAAAYPQVLIAERGVYQARVEHVQALVELWRNAALLDGMLLSGGLEAPFHSSVQLPPATGHVPTGGGRAAD